MPHHHCGAENADDARFCSGCGERIATSPTKACPQCKAENAPDARFCNSCGTPVDQAPATASPASSKWKIVAGALALVVVLAGAGIGWILSAGSATQPVAADAKETVVAEGKRAPSATRQAAPQPVQVSTSTPDERKARIARVQEIHGKKPLGSRNPTEACADRGNVITRSICEASKCNEAAYARHPTCLALFERQDEEARMRRDGYIN